MEKLDRITVNPEICLGQPTIRGMRITVSVILKMLASGKSIQEILEAYPELEEEDVRQAIRYAAWVVSDQIHMLKSLSEIKEEGWIALVERLGISGATLFMLEYEKGYGDYTEERKRIFGQKPLDEIVQEIKEKMVQGG